MNSHKVTRPFWVNAEIGVAVEGQEVPIDDPIRARQLMLSGLIEDSRSDAEKAEDAARHGRVVGIAPRTVATDPIAPPSDPETAAAAAAPSAPVAGPDAAQAAAGAPETAAAAAAPSAPATGPDAAQAAAGAPRARRAAR
jgi:hypothetical protein